MSRPRKASGTVYHRKDSAFWWISFRDREGQIILESTLTTDRQEAERFLRQRLDARDDGNHSTVLSGKILTFGKWADWFLEMRSKPPFRAEKTHFVNLNTVKLLLPTFVHTPLSDIAPEAIENYLKHRLNSGKRVHTKLGIQIRAKIKPMTLHQEFRVLKRMLNVAVKQRRLASNPCNAVEFPVRVNNTTRKPHCMTTSEQKRIESCAPNHLRNVIAIISETGLRPYKELMPMKKSQVDLHNSVVHIPNSKTPSGVGDIPLTPLARQAFKQQKEETLGSEYIFPTPKPGSKKPHITTLKETWTATLRRAGVPYFPLYHLRHNFATRLSAGGVSDHFVTQMLRQGDSQVFKRYSQAKLNMMREALTRLDRRANEHESSFVTARPN
ncbi:MAG TPA: tyrosine-type recombinase/integrase [Terriglobia bacterium]|nr:tyrosine-type recombinase/integrase [Terriglobia bacterium]